jgi:hypothetical protein
MGWGTDVVGDFYENQPKQEKAQRTPFTKLGSDWMAKAKTELNLTILSFQALLKHHETEEAEMPAETFESLLKALFPDTNSPYASGKVVKLRLETRDAPDLPEGSPLPHQSWKKGEEQATDEEKLSFTELCVALQDTAADAKSVFSVFMKTYKGALCVLVVLCCTLQDVMIWEAHKKGRGKASRRSSGGEDEAGSSSKKKKKRGEKASQFTKEESQTRTWLPDEGVLSAEIMFANNSGWKMKGILAGSAKLASATSEYF